MTTYAPDPAAELDQEVLDTLLASDGVAAVDRRLLRRDLRAAAQSLTVPQVRYLVDTYYSYQKFRLSSSNQVRALTVSGEPHLAITWTGARMKEMEADVLVMLDSYTNTEPTGMGAWAKEICGIGPVISAGLVAHLDITQAPTVGHWWRFAGLDPTSKWEKGKKRPWNAGLKVLCYKIGESFVKVQNRDDDVYGKLYASRKQQEQAKNLAGDFADQAKRAITEKKYGEDTSAKKYYEQGQLPPAHIHARARRYAVKQFLADYHAECYFRHYGAPPPFPYPISILGHAHLDDRQGTYARAGQPRPATPNSAPVPEGVTPVKGGGRAFDPPAAPAQA
jgi:hypothetical protein